jgi:hypothetical protein
VAILKSPPRPPKNATLQIRVKEQIKVKLHKYAELIGSSESYVASEALKLLFKKDDEFKTWLETPPRNGEQPRDAHASATELFNDVVVGKGLANWRRRVQHVGTS